jgi:hypothetical protein
VISVAKLFRGGLYNSAISGSIALDPRVAVCWRLRGSSTPTVTLPDARLLVPDLQAYIHNYGTSPTWAEITIKDAAGGTVGTVAPESLAILYLFDNDDAAGTWSLDPRTLI